MNNRVGLMVKYLLCISLFLSCNSKINQELKSDEVQSIAKAISVYGKENVSEAINKYYVLKKEAYNSYNFQDEGELNNYGYELLGEGRVEDAIEIFKLLVSEFPDAYNPYDSLAEAFFTNGNEAEAIRNYEKSLQLNPKNYNAEEWINRIKYPEYDSTRFYKTYNVREYKEDLDELARRLTEINPNVYKFITKEDFWKVVGDKKNALNDQTTFSDFIWDVSEIVSSVNCSHTYMGGFNQERKMIPMNLRFPAEIRLIENRFYVANPLINSDRLHQKDEIVEINGIPVDVVREEIYKHIPSQGSIETSKKNFINNHSTSIISYAMGFPKTYKVRLKSQDETIQLKMLENYTNRFQELVNLVCPEPLCLEFLDDGQSAIMTIRTFAYYGNSFQEFTSFIDSSFMAVKDRRIRNLMIDLRGNGGGPSYAAIYLLRYLAQEPFTYFASAQFNESMEAVGPFGNAFRGKLYFMIDGNGHSTTGHFMSMIKDMGIARLIGEELGSNHFCTGGQVTLRLPHTGILFSVARNTYMTTATSTPIDRGVMPDHYIVQSIDDYLSGKDTVKEFTLNLIRRD